MSISKKVKKAGEAINKSVDKLIKLVNKKAPKNKILKQVDKVQGLNMEKKSLQKKVSSKGADQKIQAVEKKAKASGKTFAEKPGPTSKETEDKLGKNRSSIAKSKEVESPVTKKTSSSKAVSKSKSDADMAMVSMEMNARSAIYKITEFSTLKQLEDFVKGDKRKTVLERANARKNALADQK